MYKYRVDTLSKNVNNYVLNNELNKQLEEE